MIFIKNHSKPRGDTEAPDRFLGVIGQRVRLSFILHVSVGVIIGLALGCVLGYVFFEPDSSSIAVKHSEQPLDSSLANNAGCHVTLPTRSYDPEGRQYKHEQKELSLEDCAVVLIDIWASTHEGIRFDSYRREKIIPLLELARENGIAVIHAYHGREVADDCAPIAGEIVMDSANARDDCEELNDYLKSRNICTLFYAGYATNMCILNRPVGIINMSRLGYNVVLVRDCTLAVENDVSMEGQWAKEMAVFMVELNWGSTTTLDELAQALSRRNDQE